MKFTLLTNVQRDQRQKAFSNFTKGCINSDKFKKWFAISEEPLGHNRSLLVSCSVSVVVIQYTVYSRLAPELVPGTVKKSKVLGATALKHRADQQQTKSFVYILCSSCPKLFVCCCSALCFKTVAPSILLFLMVPVTSLGPSQQSSTPCQQTFPCCTICLVWLAPGAWKIPYALGTLTRSKKPRFKPIPFKPKPLPNQRSLR